MVNKVLNIGVIASGIDEEYQYYIIQGINSFVKENNINAMYFTSFGGVLANSKYDMGEYNIFNLINYAKLDGIIFMSNTISSLTVREYVISQVKAANIPTIVFDSDHDPEFYNIAIDNFKAMEDIVKHIVEEHKVSRVNYVSGPMENPESRQRYEAYISVLKENNIEPEEERIFFGEFRAADGREAAEKFLNSQLEFPQAIICANDAMALALVTTLERNGIKVPDDVLVTGFDNTYMARNYVPEITTVDRPLNQLGYMACDIIHKVCNSEDVAKKHIVFTNPVFSESCGCSQNDMQRDPRQFKKENYNMIETCNYHISVLNRMNSELAESESIEHHITIINKFLDEVGCNDFYLCLCENWMGRFTQQTKSSSGECSSVEEYQVDGYTRIMNVPLCRDNKKIIECGEFHSEDMIPVPFSGTGNIAYFFPIHFRERCLGYCVVKNNDFPIKNMLFHTLIMTISNAIENVRKLSQLNSAISELDKLYVIDPLCEIYNRNGFIRSANPIFRSCIADTKNIMIMFIDMDGLKIINDQYSHKEGDFALKTFAAILRECCSEGEICARFGGDEFLIFASDFDYPKAELLEKKIQAKMEEVNNAIGKPYPIAASIGCYITPATEDLQLFSAITKADQKMYEQKKRKKTSRYLRHT